MNEDEKAEIKEILQTLYAIPLHIDKIDSELSRIKSIVDHAGNRYYNLANKKEIAQMAEGD